MGCTSSVAALQLATYNKKAKRHVLNPAYEHFEKIFEEIESLINKDKGIMVVDIGSGVGTHLPMLSKTFLAHNNDTLICIDPSPRNIQLARQVVDKDKHAQNQTVKFIQNSSYSLCLTPQYESSVIDLCFSAFVLRQISSRNKARETILNQVYQCLKPNGLFVVFESSKSFMHTTENKVAQSLAANKNAQDTDSDSEWDENDAMVDNFSELNDLVKYVESFGFQLNRQILENELETHWILVFRK